MLIGSMQALEIMKTHVVKTTPDASLAEAVDLMDLYQVHGLPVVDGTGKLCGMLTEHDIWEALQQAGNFESASMSLPSRLVGDIMTRPAIAVVENENLAVAVALMTDNRLKRLPVITKEGTVIGTLNRIDIIQAILEQAP